MLPSGVGRLSATLPFDAVETVNLAEELHFSLESSQENRKRASFYAGVRGARLGVSDAHDPSAVGLAYTLIPGPRVDEAALRHALANGQTQPCRMAGAQRLQRLVKRLPRPAMPGLRALRRGLGWGGRVLKRLTGADQAQAPSSLGPGRLRLDLEAEQSILTRRYRGSRERDHAGMPPRNLTAPSPPAAVKRRTRAQVTILKDNRQGIVSFVPYHDDAGGRDRRQSTPDAGGSMS